MIIARAAELRRAGVQSMTLDGASVQLAPWIEPSDKRDDKPAHVATEPTSVFDDPASYPTGVVPGFTIHQLGEER